MTTPLIEARGLCAGYGSIAVVHDLELAVMPGEVSTLIGPNGAGKSTTLMTLVGAIPALSGELLVDGRPSKAALHDRARSGLAFVPEQRSVMMDMTTAENFRLGRIEPEAAIEVFHELEPLMDRKAGLLSGGEQQMLTLARAIARRPRALVADELSLGLAPLIVRRLLDAVCQAAKDDQVGVLLVEQHVHLALEVSDRVHVMRRGRVTFSGSAEELRADPNALEDAYFAGAVAD